MPPSPVTRSRSRRPWPRLEAGVSQAPLAPTKDLVNASHMMIANPFRAQDISRLMATHPPMADRIARLQGMATGYRPN